MPQKFISKPALLLVAFLVGSGALAQSSPQADLNSARTLFKQGRFQDAAAAYRAIVEKDPSSDQAYAGLVQSYLKADNVASADQSATQALVMLPQSSLVHSARGDVYFRHGLLANAQSEYLKALQLDDGSARALLGLGRLYLAVAENHRARELIAKAHAIDPDDGDALYHWAVLLPYPQSVAELEKHLAAYRPNDDDERREREFIDLLKGIGNREVWIGPKDTDASEIKLELLSPHPGAVSGLGIRANLNDRVNGTFLLDTGATWLTIPQNVAQKVGVRKISDYAIEGVGDSGPSGGYFAWVDKITVGSIEFHDCVVHVSNKSDASGEDGVLGTDIFSRYLLTIDFPGRKLKLQALPRAYLVTAEMLAHPIPDLPSPRAFNFGHLLLLPTRINGANPGLFVLDSGANASSISPELARRAGNLSATRIHVTGSSGEVNQISVLENASLEFSDSRVSNRNLLAFDRHSLSQELGTEVSGFIGFDILSRMQITISYRDGWVRMEHKRH